MKVVRCKAVPLPVVIAVAVFVYCCFLAWLSSYYTPLNIISPTLVVIVDSEGTLKNPRRCPSKNHLLFVKTHKTGSTTVLNVFQRYAYSHYLSVALPAKGDVFLGWPNLLGNVSQDILPSSQNTFTYDFIINHLIYNESLLLPLLKPGHIKVTIVRSALDQLRSSFNYYEILHESESIGDVVDSMNLFARDPVRFDGSYYEENWFVKSRTRNPQLADLGMPYDDMKDGKKVSEKIKRLIDEFDVILVSEMMDESLLLVKRRMCWTLKDIFYHRNYELTYAGKNKTISEKIAEKLLIWDAGDYLLHQRAKQKLLETIYTEYQFSEELQQFQAMNRKVEKYCLNYQKFFNPNGKVQPLVLARSAWNTQYILDDIYCKHYLRPERAFTRLLKYNVSRGENEWKQYKEIEKAECLISKVS